MEKIIIPDVETEEQKAARLAKEAEEEAEKARKEAEEQARLEAERLAKEKELEEKETEIEIDGVTYKLDENGNAVDGQGEIKFTKEDIDSFSENSTEDYFQSISKITGIEVKDENGNPLTFEPTIKGFAQRESAVKALGEKEGFDKGFKQFLTNNPDLADIIDYKNRYGTIEGYQSHVDYSKIELSDNENELADLIYKAEVQKGTSVDRAKRMVEFARMNNTLKDDARESLEWLKKAQAAEEENIRKQREDAIREQQAATIAYYGISYDENGKVQVHDAPNSLYDMVVVKGVIGNYTIPQEGIKVKTDKGLKLISRAELFDYFATPVKEINGALYSQAQLDEMKKMENPAELALRFMTNIAGGMEQLVNSSITKEKIKDIRRLKTNPSKTKTTRTYKTGDGNEKIILPV